MVDEFWVGEAFPRGKQYRSVELVRNCKALEPLAIRQLKEVGRTVERLRVKSS